MSIRRIDVTSLGDLVTSVQELALRAEGDYIFRGHRKEHWPLQSTFARFSTSKLFELQPLAIEQILNRYAHALAMTGAHDFKKRNRRERLEVARHHGLPSPLIDFTQSPFIALWFAFNGVRASVDTGNVVLYALNWNYMGAAFGLFADEVGMDFKKEYKLLPMDFFRREVPTLFDSGYPQPALKFIQFAHSENTKMQRQMGCFIYDTLDYRQLGMTTLEDLINNHSAFEKVSKNSPILIKYYIPKSLAREAFGYLDMLGINGARLMDDYTGAAADVINGYNYTPRMKAWDI